MIWLVLSSLLSFGFAQLFKWAERRGCYAPVVLSSNYVVLGCLLLAFHLFTGQLNVTRQVLSVGSMTGVSFIVSMFVMTRALEVTKVTMVFMAFRLSVLLPIIADVLIWSERVTTVQLSGIAMGLVSLMLMSCRGKTRRQSRWQDLGWAVGVFGSQGVSQIFLQSIHYAGLDPLRLQVLMMTAFVAGMLGSIFVIFRRRRPSGSDLRTGAGIGIYNLLALAAILTALSRMDGTIVFPVHGCAVVILDCVFAHFVWKETISRLALIGAVLGAFSMLLVV